MSGCNTLRLGTEVASMKSITIVQKDKPKSAHLKIHRMGAEESKETL
jgi:hypothetical protein